ncbi:vacuolar protein sorting-associated protein 33B [Epinephelus moara]|uniref:vacuolar protein sorting-associated protein 33B n=1 Tax=Epinephelus moara TaxID=300413 RepID=UPI00214E5AB0|nr:vacuolar protein sorting-associated protein 33B [Epinephelus moara]
MAHSGRRDSPELPDFSLLKRLARDQLIYLLEQLPGKKDLFIEADLMSPLDRIANVSTLKQHEVDKLYKVEYKPIISTSDQLCFLIRPRIQTVKWICDVANADKAAGKFRRYKIIFAPQKFYACEVMMEEQGIFGDVTTDEWSFYLLPLDDDIISMELPEFFRDNFLAGDQRWVRTAGSALHLLHSLYGPFSKLYGIGRCSKMAYESWREQVEEGEQKARIAEIGKVFLIDRDVDFVTPLCSQVVYEGLVDDIFRIKCGCVEFGPDVSSSDKSIKVMLNSQDKVGLMPKDYRSLKAQYLQSYGVDHLLTFANLRQLGLLVEQQQGETLTVMESKVGKLVNDKTAGKLTDAFSSLAKKSNFRALSRKLSLVPKSDAEYDLRVPRDMAYIFSGAYVPLSCKLIEQVLERDGWTGLEEVARLLNGHEFAVTGSNGADLKVRNDAQRIILVMFLGGCTFSEISALRFLGRERGYKFIVVTTAITNSSRLIEALLDNRV